MFFFSRKDLAVIVTCITDKGWTVTRITKEFPSKKWNYRSISRVPDNDFRLHARQRSVTACQSNSRFFRDNTPDFISSRPLSKFLDPPLLRVRQSSCYLAVYTVASADHRLTDLDAGRAALCDGVRNGGSWRINHRHEADKPQSCQREVLRLGVEHVRRWISIHRQATND